jgi:2-methylcitrate dehydratase PrpD
MADGSTTENGTRALAKFVVGARLEDLPDDLLPHVRRSILDCLGVAIGAIREQPVEIVLRLVDTLGGAPQATIWATDRRTSVTHAALANGYMAHVLDFDDSYVPEITVLHGNAPILPPAVAIGEWRDGTGADLALAFALGFEVAARIALAAGSSMFGRYHVTGLVGGFGATAAVGKLLNLNAQQLTYAFGVANAQAGATGQYLGTMTKPLHAGRGAMSGVYAGLLAQEDFTSAPDALTGPAGFNDAYPSDRNFAALLGELGTRWELRRAAFKPYACGVVQHALLDGVLELREMHGVRAEDVEAVEGRVNPHVLRATGKTDPQTDLESKFSAYHSVAMLLLQGAAGPQQYAGEYAQDAAVRALRSRVRLTVDEQMRSDEAHVQIVLRDGRVLERHVPHASGTAANPMTDEQLRRKFHLLVDPILGQDRARSIVDAVNAIEKLPSVRTLTALLTGSRAP